MLIIRFRNGRKDSVIKKNNKELILIDKSKALHSEGFKLKLGKLNKNNNILSVKYDLLLKSLGNGCLISNNSFKLLRYLFH